MSGQIQTSDKNGYDKNLEGPDNFKQAIGSIELNKVPDDVWRDEKLFRQLLGFPQEKYYVKYRK